MNTSQPNFGIVVAKDIMVSMRDGTRLATDVYFPARDGQIFSGRFPTILGRTSYDKSNEWLWVKPVCEYFCMRGYVVVCQDLRGRYRSEGFGQYFHTANVNEGADGYDTVEWIAAQPWSNGRVGMTGSSHGAIVQQVAALLRPPHLAAIWPDVGPTNIYAHEAREGGAMSLQMFGALFLHAFDAQEVHAREGAQAAIVEAMEKMREWACAAPFKPGQTPLSLVPALEKTLFDYYWRGEYDEFWSQECCNQEPYWDRHADIPGVYSGGWWDPFAGGISKYFATMSGQNKTPQKLVLGAWTHDGMRAGFTHGGDADFGEQSIWGYDYYNEQRLRWFDRWLKDVPTGVEDDPPVRIFVMGGGDGHKTPEGHLYHGGAWRSENEWPIARTEHATFYVHSGGGLSREKPGADDAPMRYAFDPSRPVPTLGGSLIGFYEMVPVLEGIDPWFANYIPWRVRMREIIHPGPYHQQEMPGFVGAQPPYLPLAARSDVLVFETDPLIGDIEVTGVVAVHLWIASSARDTDFTAKLVDVYPPSRDYPNGYHMGLVDSIIRTRYRESWEHEVLMEPGKAYEVKIEMAPTSNLFTVGHRIRIDISSSNFPRFDVNPNTGEPMGRHTGQQVAHQTVFVDAGRPSWVDMPIIPR
jgi:putative CocE/NonD family hydrolase